MSYTPHSTRPETVYTPLSMSKPRNPSFTPHAAIDGTKNEGTSSRRTDTDSQATSSTAPGAAPPSASKYISSHLFSAAENGGANGVRRGDRSEVRSAYASRLKAEGSANQSSHHGTPSRWTTSSPARATPVRARAHGEAAGASAVPSASLLHTFVAPAGASSTPAGKGAAGAGSGERSVRRALDRDEFFGHGGGVTATGDDEAGGLDDPTTRTYVTIFGFEPSQASLVLSGFRQVGLVNRVHMSEGNWMHISYDREAAVHAALSKNGRMLNERCIIGVMRTPAPLVRQLLDDATAERGLIGLEPLTPAQPGGGDSRAPRRVGAAAASDHAGPRNAGHFATPRRAAQGSRVAYTPGAAAQRSVVQPSSAQRAPEPETSSWTQLVAYIFGF